MAVFVDSIMVCGLRFRNFPLGSFMICPVLCIVVRIGCCGFLTSDQVSTGGLETTFGITALNRVLRKSEQPQEGNYRRFRFLVGSAGNPVRDDLGHFEVNFDR